MSAAAQPRPLRIAAAVAASPGQVPTTPPSPARAQLAPRQPLLYAVLSLSAGILLGARSWRPPLWWALALLVFLAAGAILLRRRPRWAAALACGALALLGAFVIQARGPVTVNNEILRFADGSSVKLTAHVITDGFRRQGGFGAERQVVEVETEKVEAEISGVDLQTGIRLTIYSRPQGRGEAKAAAPVPLYIYGQRLRLVAKLRPPRNFGNPGAFDYRGYLAQRGIATLGSPTKRMCRCCPGSWVTGLPSGVTASGAAC